MTRKKQSAHKPTAKSREQVATLAGLGLPQDKIVLVIGITRYALMKHYRAELDAGVAQADAAVMQSLYKLATSGPPAQRASCAIFWAKSRLGWRTTDKPPTYEQPHRPDAAEEDKPEKLGKKEQQQRDAEAIEGHYATPPPPSRLN